MKNLLTTLKKYFDGGVNHFVRASISGLFWLAPIAAMAMIVLWLYGKADIVAGKLFHIMGIIPIHYPILWTLVGIFILVLASYIVGHFIETRIGSWFKNSLEFILSKIPGYRFISDLIGLFNSSKSGDKKVLVVMINGFSGKGYNIGLMYSTEESIVKEHYSVVLSQTPLPNGGYIFEEHSDNIFVLDELVFNNYMTYLLSMGSKSIAKLANVQSKPIEELQTLTQWLAMSKTGWKICDCKRAICLLHMALFISLNLWFYNHSNILFVC